MDRKITLSAGKKWLFIWNIAIIQHISCTTRLSYSKDGPKENESKIQIVMPASTPHDILCNIHNYLQNKELAEPSEVSRRYKQAVGQVIKDRYNLKNPWVIYVFTKPDRDKESKNGGVTYLDKQELLNQLEEYQQSDIASIELILGEVELTDQELALIGDHLGKKISRLIISNGHGRITDEGLLIIIDKCKHLNELFILLNDNRNHPLTDQHATAIANNKATLKKLCISGNTFTNEQLRYLIFELSGPLELEREITINDNKSITREVVLELEQHYRNITFKYMHNGSLELLLRAYHIDPNTRCTIHIDPNTRCTIL